MKVYSKIWQFPQELNSNVETDQNSILLVLCSGQAKPQKKKKKKC